MRNCGEQMTDQSIVEKVLRTLLPKFDHIVVVIEEVRDIETLELEELQGALEAHKQRLKERQPEKKTDQTLQAQVKKGTGDSGNSKKGKGKGNSGDGAGKKQETKDQGVG